MRVVDTSAWIEWLLDSPTSRLISDHLPPLANWIVPTIVQYELAKWAIRESKNRSSKRVVAFSRELVVWELTTEIATRAARLSATSALAAADAIIYATALESGADLLTCDAHFEALPGVIYLPNKPN